MRLAAPLRKGIRPDKRHRSTAWGHGATNRMLRTCSRVCCSSHALCPLSLWRWQEGSTFGSRRRTREKNLNGVHAEMPLRPSYQCTIVTRIMVNAGENGFARTLATSTTYFVLDRAAMIPASGKVSMTLSIWPSKPQQDPSSPLVPARLRVVSSLGCVRVKRRL